MFIGIGIGVPLSRGASRFSPASLGTPVSWVKGDDATMVGDSLVYSSLTDLGSLGGTFDAATNAHPAATAVIGRNAATFNGKRRFAHSVAAASWTGFHDATSNRTLSGTVYPHTVSSGATIWTTKAVAAGSRGLRVGVNASSQIEATWSDSTTNTTVTSTVTVTAAAYHTWVIRKTGTGVSLSVDNETPVTGTITGSASAAAHAPVLGNLSDGTAPFHGLIPEVIGYGLDVGASGSDSLDSYFGTQWSATPAFSALQLATNLLADWDLRYGVTLNGSDVSALGDQSGHSSHQAQATPSLQPGYNATGVNGLPSMQGHDIADCLTATLTTGALSQPCTVVVFGQWADAAYGGGYLTAGSNFQLLAREQSSNPGLYAGTDLITTGTAATRDTVFGGVWQFNGASSAIKVEFDGAAVNAATGLNPGSASGTAIYHLLAKESGGFGGLHQIARCLVYAGTLSDTDRDALLAEGATLYGYTAL